MTTACMMVIQKLIVRVRRARDVGYIATIQIGTPARDFKLLMDSGSADFWVGSETCVSEGGGDCVRIHTVTYCVNQVKLILSVARVLIPSSVPPARLLSRTPRSSSRSLTALAMSPVTSSQTTSASPASLSAVTPSVSPTRSLLTSRTLPCLSTVS